MLMMEVVTTSWLKSGTSIPPTRQRGMRRGKTVCSGCLPNAGETGHRDPDKFWVTQAVLNYAPVPFEGHSLNYWGARIMNPLVTLIYEDSWRHGHTHPWNG